MLYRWIARRQVEPAWRSLSGRDLDKLPLADDMHFSFAGDHALAAELSSAADVRTWVAALFERLPGLRFKPHEIVVDGPPWNTRVVSLYTAMLRDQPAYRGSHFVRMRWGRVIDERVLPDTQAVAKLAPIDNA